MHARALRSRILLALGLPAGALGASCQRPAPPEAPLASAPEPSGSLPVATDDRFAKPPRSRGGACAIDEVRESICGVVLSVTGEPGPSPFEGCGTNGAELTSYGRVRVLRRPALTGKNPALSPFAFDADKTRPYAEEYRRAAPGARGEPCCFSRCTALEVTDRPRGGVPHGFVVRETCVPAPEGGTRVPAAGDGGCPAGVRLDPDAGEGAAPFRRRTADTCCYGTLEPMARCLPGQVDLGNGRCGERHYRGRPYREEGVFLVARPTRDARWADGAHDFARVPRALRRDAAAAWTRDAAAEHASIAAFARLSLELLSLGAPPELVDGAHDAARDEIRHARLAYGVASALAGEAIGPAPSSFASRARAVDLEALARETFIDGCVGETVAALGAAEARERVRHGSIADVLDVIAEDEAAHAALAFRVVAWAVAEGGAPVAQAIERLAASLEAHPPAPGGAEDALASLGVVDDATADDVRARAIGEIVKPMVAALLASRDDLERPQIHATARA